MTDHNQAQVNAIRATFPECSCVFYCWWHVLRAIRTHFNTKHFPVLWSRIQDWVHTTNNDEFNAHWAYIEGDTSVPNSMAQYIACDWLPHKEMWSAMSHQNRTIFEKGDTNMLLEAYVITFLFKKHLFITKLYISSYHHVLKSIWLDGKRNWHMDHLIHMLVKEFLSEAEHRHKRQSLRMEGLNLAEKRWRQILKRAPKTPIEKIKKIDDLHFEVQSSKSNDHYQIDLSTIICNCADFPNISLCKHIAAVIHFFGEANLGPQPPEYGGSNAANASELVELKSPGQPVSSMRNNNAVASIISAANDNIELLQKLITKAPSDLKIARSLNSIQSQLTALLSAMAIDDGSWLPEKESIAPNQHTWLETAARMGEKHGTKRSRGKVDSALMAQHIGEPNCKCMTDNDPYGAGEQSSKRAKPDARSADANAQARKAAEQEALKAEPPLPPASQPLPTPLPLPPMLPLPASQTFHVMCYARTSCIVQID